MILTQKKAIYVPYMYQIVPLDHGYGGLIFLLPDTIMVMRMYFSLDSARSFSES